MATKQAKQLPISKFLEWWFDPKNGKIGNSVTVTDKKSKSPTFGKQITITTTGFHSVTSGANDLIRDYYKVEDIKAFWEQCVKAKLCTTRPAKLGMMVYPYSGNSNQSKVNDLKAEMGIK